MSNSEFMYGHSLQSKLVVQQVDAKPHLVEVLILDGDDIEGRILVSKGELTWLANQFRDEDTT